MRGATPSLFHNRRTVGRTRRLVLHLFRSLAPMPRHRAPANRRIQIVTDLGAYVRIGLASCSTRECPAQERIRASKANFSHKVCMAPPGGRLHAIEKRQSPRMKGLLRSSWNGSMDFIGRSCFVGLIESDVKLGDSRNTLLTRMMWLLSLISRLFSPRGRRSRASPAPQPQWRLEFRLLGSLGVRQSTK
jgi:hypothetical protein